MALRKNGNMSAFVSTADKTAVFDFTSDQDQDVISMSQRRRKRKVKGADVSQADVVHVSTSSLEDEEKENKMNSSTIINTLVENKTSEDSIKSRSSEKELSKLSADELDESNQNSPTTGSAGDTCDVIRQCPICCKKFLPNEAAHERRIHVNNCLDGNVQDGCQNDTQSDELLAHSLQQQSFQETFHNKDLYFCNFCSKDLTKWNSKQRQVHVNKCADRTESLEIGKRKLRERKGKTRNDESVRICPLCGKPQPKMKFTRHIKACSKKNNFSAHELLDELRKAGISLECEESSDKKTGTGKPRSNATVKQRPVSSLLKAELQEDAIKSHARILASKQVIDEDLLSTPSITKSSIGVISGTIKEAPCKLKEQADTITIKDTGRKLWNLSAMSRNTKTDQYLLPLLLNCTEDDSFAPKKENVDDKDGGNEMNEEDCHESFTCTQYEKLNVLMSLNMSVEKTPDENGFISEENKSVENEIQKQAMAKFIADFNALLQTSLQSDLLLHCQGNVDLPCHQLILMTRCAPLLTLVKDGGIDLQTFSPATVGCSLSYLYTGSIDVSKDVDLKELHLFSERFKLPLLTQACVNINPSLNTIQPLDYVQSEDIVDKFWKNETSFHCGENDTDENKIDIEEENVNEEIGEDSRFSDDEFRDMQEIFRSQVVIQNDRLKTSNSESEFFNSRCLNRDLPNQEEVSDTCKITTSLQEVSDKSVTSSTVELDCSTTSPCGVENQNKSSGQFYSSEVIETIDNMETLHKTVLVADSPNPPKQANSRFSVSHGGVESQSSDSCDEAKENSFDTTKIKSTPELYKRTASNPDVMACEQSSPAPTPIPFSCETPAVFNNSLHETKKESCFDKIHDESSRIDGVQAFYESENYINNYEESDAPKSDLEGTKINCTVIDNDCTSCELHATIIHTQEEADVNSNLYKNAEHQVNKHTKEFNTDILTVTYSQTVDFMREEADCQIIQPGMEKVNPLRGDALAPFGDSILAENVPVHDLASPCVLRPGKPYVSSTPMTETLSKQLLNKNHLKIVTAKDKTTLQNIETVSDDPSRQTCEVDVICLTPENKSSTESLSSSCESPQMLSNFKKQVKRKRGSRTPSRTPSRRGSVSSSTTPDGIRSVRSPATPKEVISSSDDDVSDHERTFRRKSFQGQHFRHTPSRKRRRMFSSYSPTQKSGSWLSSVKKQKQSSKELANKKSKQQKGKQKVKTKDNDFKRLVKSLTPKDASPVDSVSSSDECEKSKRKEDGLAEVSEEEAQFVEGLMASMNASLCLGETKLDDDDSCHVVLQYDDGDSKGDGLTGTQDKMTSLDTECTETHENASKKNSISQSVNDALTDVVDQSLELLSDNQDMAAYNGDCKTTDGDPNDDASVVGYVGEEDAECDGNNFSMYYMDDGGYNSFMNMEPDYKNHSERVERSDVANESTVDDVEGFNQSVRTTEKDVLENETQNDSRQTKLIEEAEILSDKKVMRNNDQVMDCDASTQELWDEQHNSQNELFNDGSFFNNLPKLDNNSEALSFVETLSKDGTKNSSGGKSPDNVLVSTSTPITQKKKNVTGNQFVTPCASDKDKNKLSTAPFGPGCSAHPDTNEPITPMPDYSHFPTPELKDAIKSFGLRGIPKAKMIAKMKEVYKFQHDFENWEGEKVKITRKSRKKKKTDEEKDTQVEENQTKETKGPKKAKLQTKATDECDETPLKLQLMEFLKYNAELHNKIITYQPLEFLELWSSIKANSITCSRKSLETFLDEQCICYYTSKDEDQKPRSRARRKKVKK